MRALIFACLPGRADAVSFVGTDLVVNSGYTDYLSVAPLSASEAVVCYRDYSNSRFGTCNHLTVSGSTLSKGADLVVNSGRTRYLSVARLSASEAVVCYSDYSSSRFGTCNHLTVSGSTLSKGADLVVNSGYTD